MTAVHQSADDQRRLDFWWQQLKAVFGLPIPNGFPPVWKPSPAEAAAVERYLEVMPELFNSTALAGDYGLQVDIDDDDTEHVTEHYPTREALRALAPLFRQFHAPGEQASFKRVFRIVSDQAMADPQDSPERRKQLATWTRAANKLGTHWLEHLAAESVGMPWPADHGWPNPDSLIDEFFYAEHLHWVPAKAQAAKQRAVDPFESAWHRHQALKAIAQFAYLYISFGSVLAVASGSYKLPPP